MRGLEVASVGELDAEVFGDDTAEKVDEEDEEEYDNEKGCNESEDGGEVGESESDGGEMGGDDNGKLRFVERIGLCFVGMETGLTGRTSEGPGVNGGVAELSGIRTSLCNDSVDGLTGVDGVTIGELDPGDCLGIEVKEEDTGVEGKDPLFEIKPKALGPSNETGAIGPVELRDSILENELTFVGEAGMEEGTDSEEDDDGIGAFMVFLG
ncbi:hypothetical protein BGZ76_002803 [Entomortierella beljakovae]|nr:hypothetical protein BGZ76_002803 [Entomortierella beljakovae]